MVTRSPWLRLCERPDPIIAPSASTDHFRAMIALAGVVGASAINDAYFAWVERLAPKFRIPITD